MLEQQNTPANSDPKATTAPETEVARTATAEPIDAVASQPALRKGVPVFLVTGAVVLAVVIFLGIHSRMRAEAHLATATAQAMFPSVIVVHPKLATGGQELILPGSTQAFVDSPIYARTNGYLKNWYADILS